MGLLFRAIRFLVPLLFLYMILKALRNFMYFFGSSGYGRERTSYSSSSGAGQKASGQHRTATDRKTGTKDPYTVLGCSPRATNDEVRRCYRKMVARYHPDRFIGQELDQDFIDLATEKFKEVQHAYEQIKRMRGMA